MSGELPAAAVAKSQTAMWTPKVATQLLLWSCLYLQLLLHLVTIQVGDYAVETPQSLSPCLSCCRGALRVHRWRYRPRSWPCWSHAGNPAVVRWCYDFVPSWTFGLVCPIQNLSGCSRRLPATDRPKCFPPAPRCCTCDSSRAISPNTRHGPCEFASSVCTRRRKRARRPRRAP